MIFSVLFLNHMHDWAFSHTRAHINNRIIVENLKLARVRKDSRQSDNWLSVLVFIVV